MRGKSPWRPGKGPKKVLKIGILEKRIGKVGTRSRRIDWYIVLRNVGRTEQRGFVCRPPS